MFVSTTVTDRIEQFTLSVPFDLSSTLTQGTPLLDSDRGKVINPYSLQFNTDGTKMFFAKFGGDLFEFSLSTAFDISPSSAAVDDDAVKKTLSNGNTTGFVFNADGTKLFAVDNGDTKQVDEYSLSTGFDINSLKKLIRLGIKRIKIPSGEITNIPLLEFIGAQKLPIILSTGMSTLSEITHAYQILVRNGASKKSISVLHCTSSYPAPNSDMCMGLLNSDLIINDGISSNIISLNKDSLIPICAEKNEV